MTRLQICQIYLRERGQDHALLKKELLVKAGIKCIEILGVEPVGGKSQTFTEALIMHYLTLAQELDGILYIRIIAKTQDVVICRTRLLLCCDCVKATFQKFQ